MSFDPPDWLHAFAQFTVRPLLRRLGQARINEAVERWHRVRNDQHEAARQWAERHRDAQPGTVLDDEPPFDDPLDYIRSIRDECAHDYSIRTLSCDECIAACAAIHDAVYDPREHVGPADGNGYDPARYHFVVLKSLVKSLKEANLPDLMAMVAEIADLPSSADVIVPTTATDTTLPSASLPKGTKKDVIVAGLSQHHKYCAKRCGNYDPVPLTKFAKFLGLAPATLSAFMQEHFDGHDNYVATCRHDRVGFHRILQALNGDLPAVRVLGDAARHVADSAKWNGDD